MVLRSTCVSIALNRSSPGVACTYLLTAIDLTFRVSLRIAAGSLLIARITCAACPASVAVFSAVGFHITVSNPQLRLTERGSSARKVRVDVLSVIPRAGV